MKKYYDSAEKIIITAVVAMVIWPIGQYVLADRSLADAESELKSKMESLQAAQEIKEAALKDEAEKRDGVCKQRIKVAAIKLNDQEYEKEEGRLKQILNDCFYDFQLAVGSQKPQ